MVDKMWLVRDEDDDVLSAADDTQDAGSGASIIGNMMVLILIVKDYGCSQCPYTEYRSKALPMKNEGGRV